MVETTEVEPTVVEEVIQAPFVDLLPPELVESIGHLQGAIDLRPEHDVAECMREGGFEYQEGVLGSGPPIETDPIEDALAILDPAYKAPAAIGANPNQVIWE